MFLGIYIYLCINIFSERLRRHSAISMPEI